MSLGLGIFLSSIFLGSLALFIATKDRWNWKKLTLWPLGIAVALSLALYVYRLIEDRPKAERSFWDIPLKASKSDVKFIKGEPSQKEDNKWSYITNDQGGSWSTAYYVYFEEDKVWAIAFYSTKGFTWEADVQGISVGDDIDEVRRKFGEPSHVSVSKDELRRIYTYSRYNVVFEFEKNKVFAVGIYNPETRKHGVEYTSDDKTNRTSPRK